MIKFHEPYISKKLEKNYIKLTKKTLLVQHTFVKFVQKS